MLVGIAGVLTNDSNKNIGLAPLSMKRENNFPFS
uniref:Uncharacterized protein n=1 Tax=Anguilla anguilla TaxID=7936 RepID=A0A0E9SWX8_ANGAN